jgi:redox-sensitive bicupin YhaK (pirin superfamily)
MNNFIIHQSNSRGEANHGWLHAKHSFSFANYHNTKKMHFGVLRVLNDDKIAGGTGFGTHPHDNMEIITIPLKGALAHKDSMGNSSTIFAGDIQVMSAGTGIQHSEYNANTDETCELFQIWLFPNQRNVTPRYDQFSYKNLMVQNQLLNILSPNETENGVWIHQNAWFSIGKFDTNYSKNYALKNQLNGVYIMVISGSFEIENQQLSNRDAIGIWDKEIITINSLSQDSEILILEIPMEIKTS